MKTKFLFAVLSLSCPILALAGNGASYSPAPLGVVLIGMALEGPDPILQVVTKYPRDAVAISAAKRAACDLAFRDETQLRREEETLAAVVGRKNLHAAAAVSEVMGAALVREGINRSDFADAGYVSQGISRLARDVAAMRAEEDASPIAAQTLQAMIERHYDGYTSVATPSAFDAVVSIYRQRDIGSHGSMTPERVAHAANLFVDYYGEPPADDSVLGVGIAALRENKIFRAGLKPRTEHVLIGH